MRRCRATIPALAITAALLGLAGCGGSGDSTSSTTGPTPNQNLTAGFTGAKRQALAAAQAYFDAFSRGDQNAVCKLTTVGSSQAAIAKCRKTLASLGPSKQPKFRVVYVRVSGNSAKVLLKPTGSFGETTLFDLQRVGGEWKTVTVSVPTAP